MSRLADLMVLPPANARPRAGLGRVVDDLGATVLELVHGDPNRVGDIGGVVIHDPYDEWDPPRRALVLGVGVSTPDDVVRLLGHLGDRHAAGLIVRAPVPTDVAVAAEVARTGVALLGFTRGATWEWLAAMLRSLLIADPVGVAEAEGLGGQPAGDLFALADAIGALLDAPITIEDRGSRVLAYSGHRDAAAADPSRRRTERFRERGVFRRLCDSERPIWIDREPGDPPGELPRVAVAVRAGDRVLGSVWAAVREPLTDERMAALSEAAKMVALHLLSARAGADVERRLRAGLVSTALEGGAGARNAVRRLGLSGHAVVPLALAVREPPDRGPGAAGGDARPATDVRRLADAFARHLSAVHPGCVAALVGDVAYGLVPLGRDGRAGDDGDDGELRAVRVANDFLRRIDDRGRGVIAVGPVAHDPADLADARAGADRVLRVLRSRPRGDLVVARPADVHVESLLLELRDLVVARGDRATGSVARLIAHDARHHSRLVETLRAWLDAFGEVAVAAAAVCVHPNTFRYRLRRLAAISGLDLADPESRFAAMVQLRMVGELAER